jgi:hypothetical protein
MPSYSGRQPKVISKFDIQGWNGIIQNGNLFSYNLQSSAHMRYPARQSRNLANEFKKSKRKMDKNNSNPLNSDLTWFIWLGGKVTTNSSTTIAKL